MRKLLPLGKRVLHSVHPAPVENEQLKRYTRRRQQLVEERTRVINRLQSDVQAVVPGLLEITADAANLWFLNLLTAREDLTKLATMRRSSLLKIRGVGATYADKIEQWQASATFSDEVAWTGPMIIADAERVIELIRQIQALEKVMESVAATSNIACRIQSIPGFGPVLSATFAGEIGALDRFPAEGSLALYSGMTMLDNSSGQFAGSKNTRQVNTHMRRAMMIGVARHMESVPQSRAYYDKKRAEGKTHNQAVRALGRHLIRVIWSMLRNDRNYVNQHPIPEPAC